MALNKQKRKKKDKGLKEKTGKVFTYNIIFFKP